MGTAARVSLCVCVCVCVCCAFVASGQTTREFSSHARGLLISMVRWSKDFRDTGSIGSFRHYIQ